MALGAKPLDQGTAPPSSLFAGRLGRPFLACGIVAPLLYVATDVLAGNLWEGYSFSAQSISELSAIGAPTRPLVVPLNLTFNALMLAFGLGIWGAAGARRAQRLTAGMVIGNAAVSIIWVFFPTHLGRPVGAPAEMMNVVVGAVSMALFVAAIVCGAVGYRGWFRVYSIATLLAYLALTAAGLLLAPEASTSQPRSAVGVQERTMVAGYLLWVLLLAVLLLRESKRLSSADSSKA